MPSSRIDHARHIGTRQYARLVNEWGTAIGLRREDYGTHSLRRTKASIIYKAAGNPRAVQLLLGHTEIESTVRYLGVDVEDARSLLLSTLRYEAGRPAGDRPQAAPDPGRSLGGGESDLDSGHQWQIPATVTCRCHWSWLPVLQDHRRRCRLSRDDRNRRHDVTLIMSP